LGCACAASLAFAACSGPSSNGTPSAAGSAGEAGNTGEAGSGPADNEAGATDVSELAQWPVPNAPGTGLPNIESYDATSTPGVVHDNVTGLDWQQAPGDALFSHADAVTHCDTLSLGGFDDWRAPTFVELSSLFDAAPDDISDTTEPLYISTVFSIGVRYWTTTAPVRADDTIGRLVDFSANQCSASTTCSVGVSGTKAEALGGAFCVRTSAAPLALPRFDVKSDHVQDTFTGLSWITLPDAIQTGSYDDAVTRCDALGDGARLPSVTELISLLAPVLDTDAFPDWERALLAWSSSPVAVEAGSYWAVGDSGATEPYKAATDMARIECVR
jgi:hypothetical protein